MFTILIVDDNMFGLRTLNMALQNEQYHLYSAQNGVDALELAQQVKPDLILLDVKMPDISGFEVCKRLKASDATTDIPVIFLSALDEEDDKLQGFNIGGEDYITKPFSPEEVSARVRVHLALSAKRKELEHLREQDRQYFTQINAIQKDILDQIRHDIKSPLASIKASTYLIDRASVTQFSRIKSYTERINYAVDETLYLTERLLELAKLEVGQSIHPELVEIEPFIQKVINIYRTLAEAENIQFLTHLRIPLETTAVFDPDQIQSVISNLLSNALKYTPAKGKVSLSVSLRNQFLRIEVSDTGKGIPRQHLNKIFDRLYRVPDDKEDVAGTGLGLYIVKSVVEQHGGIIHVQSEVHKGSTFVVSIPHHQVASV